MLRDSVKREIRQGWDESCTTLTCSEYLDRALAQFPKKAVALFDSYKRPAREHQMVITIANNIIGKRNQQRLCQEFFH